MRRLLASLGITAALILGGFSIPLLTGLAPSAQALTIYKACNNGSADPNSDVCTAANKDQLIGGVLKNVINTLIYIIAIISVIVIVVGGIRYVTSAGNPQHATAARETIIYAVVGLVVSIMAYAIVNFVLNHVGSA